MKDTTTTLRPVTADLPDAVLTEPDEQAAGYNAFPLSYSQERLWLVHELDPDSPAYNAGAALELTGTLDLSLLRHALSEITRRHEILRTTLYRAGDDLMQIVSDEYRCELPVEEVQHDSEPEGRERVVKLAREFVKKPFALESGALLRTRLFRLDQQHHVLVLAVHHIVSDAWSIGIFLWELENLYEAFVVGKRSPLPELTLQYADYAVWQREWLQGEVIEEHLDYWRKQLTDLPEMLALPTDYPRPKRQRFEGSYHEIHFGTDFTQQLRRFGQERKATLFMVLMAGFKCLLHRYCGQDDIVVGTAVANRNRTEIEGLIGFFVNTLALRTDLSGDPTTEELLERLREATLGAFAYQELPFEKLVAELQPERDLARLPLFQAFMHLENTRQHKFQLPGLQIRPLSLDTESVKFDFHLFLRDEGDHLSGSLSYRTDLFKPETIARMARHYQRLLQEMITNPGRRVAELPMLDEAERREVLEELNQTQASYPPGCIHELFEQQAAKTPQAAALEHNGRPMTYQELNHRSNQLAHYLRSLGVGPEFRVGISMRRDLQMVTAMLGILKAGGVYVGLDPDYPAERLTFMLTDSQIGVLLTQSSVVGQLPAYSGTVIQVDEQWAEIAKRSADNPKHITSPENLSHLIYTSGSTGKPKGIAIRHSSAVVFLHWAHGAFLVEELSGVMACTSICWDLSIFEIFGPLTCGGTAFIVKNALELAEIASPERIKIVNAVPSAIKELVRLKAIPSATRTINLAGEALTGSFIEEVYAHTQAQRAFNLYGPSEDTTYSTYALLDRHYGSDSIPIGRPISNTQMYVLNKAMEPVPRGVAGELYIGGAGLARGYLNRSVLTAEKFVPDPFSKKGGERLYRTGDWIKWRPDGQLEFLGRIDHQVKIRGYRIEIGEIEAVLNEYPAVRECVVMAREDTAGDKRLVGYTVAKPGQVLDGNELRSYLKAKMPDYMVPGTIVVVDKLPLNANGKIDRGALPVPEDLQQAKPQDAPHDQIEEMLCGIFAEVLKRDWVGTNENFFDNGGHSLLATRVTSRIRDIFRINTPLHVIFTYPCVHDLAAWVRNTLRQQQSNNVPPLVPVERTAPLPLSFAQQRLWFLNQLEKDTSAYNFSAAIQLAGKLNITALHGSLSEIVRRHEVLRTTFPAVDGVAIQEIHPADNLSLPVIDLSTLSASLQDRAKYGLSEADARFPFDLTLGPVFRSTLLRIGEHQHVLLLSAHHIATDRWSVNIFINELKALYSAFLNGEPSPLPELPVQYADFAYWQQQWLKDEALDAQIAYWKQQLSGLEPLNLPARPPHRLANKRPAGWVSFELSQELSDRLKLLSRKEGVTLFMALQAMFAVVLGRYSSQSRIAIGTSIATRQHTEIEGLIGFFVNMLVLGNDLAGDPTVHELLQRTRELALGAYAHQDLPFEKLVDELGLQREIGQSPLLQVTFVLQNMLQQELYLPDLELKALPIQRAEVQFDIIFTLDSEPRLKGSLEFRADRFDPEFMQRMLEHYRYLLEQMVEHPDQRISRLQILTPSESRQLLQDWNQTARPVEQRTVASWVEEWAAHTPEAVAVVFGEQELSYRELNARANQLGRYLRKLGVGPEVRVGVCLERSLDLAVAVLGVLKAGGAYVPLDVSYPRQRLEYMLQDSGAQVLLTRAGLVEGLEWVGGRVVDVGQKEQEISKESGENLPVEVEAEHLAYVIYTSGSTGRPKGVEISQGNLSHYVGYCRRAYHGDGERGLDALVHSSISFDLTVTGMFSPWTVGKRVVWIGEGRGVEGLRDGIEEAGGGVLVKVTPSHLQALQGQLSGAGAERVKVLVVGGEALAEATVRGWREQANETHIVNEYGPTEATVGCCVYWDEGEKGKEGTKGKKGQTGEKSGKGGKSGKEEGQERSSVPIGRAIENTELYVLDKEMEAVPVGVAGELYIGGAGLGRGYRGQGGLTAERFVPHPYSGRGGERLYRTGDLAKWQEDGNLLFLGRRDNQVKIRGYRIELGEIEATLRRHPDVAEALVTVRTSESGSQNLIAYARMQNAAATSLQDLREWLKESLPEPMVPLKVIHVDAWPLTPSGKVDTNALPTETAELTVSTESGALTWVQEILVGIWSQLLEKQDIGISETFFAMGGHSLLATQLTARVRDVFQIDVPLFVLFENPTIESFAAWLEKALEQGRTSEIPDLKPADRSGPVPLSLAQQTLWLLHQLEPESTAYNFANAIQFTGKLDINALARSLNEIVRRHEMLRTSFPIEDNGAVQKVHSPVRLYLPVVDLSLLPHNRKDEAKLKLVKSDALQIFDLLHGPVFRFSLLKLSGQEHVLLLNVHHIVSDGWSVGIFVGEFISLYEDFCSSRNSSLPELPIQYADYAIWQKSWLNDQALDQELQYWRKQLAGLEPLELPSKSRGTGAATRSAGSASFVISEELTSKLNLLSQHEGVTLFMLMEAAFAVVLGRYSGQKLVPIGTSVANRRRLEIESLVGFFVNMLVLRNDLTGNPTVTELLARIREVALGAYSHQDVPFEKVLEDVAPGQNAGQSRLLQATFAIQNAPQKTLKLPGLEVKVLPLKRQEVQFDIILAAEPGNAMNGSLQYRADRFDSGLMERMLRHWQRILEAMADNPEQRICELEMLSAAERRQLLLEWNEERSTGPSTIIEMIEEQVENTPDLPAATFEHSSISYRELNRRANQLAWYLRSLGVGPEATIGICMERSLELLVALLGVIKSGGAYVPLDPTYPRQRLEYMFENSRAQALITREATLSTVGLAARKVVCLDTDSPAIACQNSANPPLNITPANLAYVLYTSGSTGQPKGVQVEHRGLANLAQARRDTLQIRPGSKVLQFFSFSFDAFIWEVLMTWTAGATLCLRKREELLPGHELLASLEQEEITHVTMPPSALTVLPEAELPNLHTLIVGAETCSPELVRRWGKGRRFINAYGPTETTVCATLTECVDDGTAPIGQALENLQAYVLDGDYQLTPIGVPGQLYLGGAGVARGYFGRPDLTAEKFVPAPFGPDGSRMYATGDQVLWRADGQLEFLGRLDKQLKVRGYRIEPDEVESALLACRGVKEAAVLPQFNGGGDARLIAYVVPISAPAETSHEAAKAPDLKIFITNLKEELRQTLPYYMVPSEFRTVAAIPRQPTGKVDRDSLNLVCDALQNEITHTGMASSALEFHLELIWCEVLGLKRISRDDNFFDLGGHSLLAVRLIRRIEQALGMRLPLSALFRHATIREMADLLSKSTQTELTSPVVAIQPFGSKPPIFAIHAAGGHVISYIPLARRLGLDQPFYGIQSFHESQKPTGSVEEMAASYAQHIQSVQPHGPFTLLGMSFGGVVAFEIARQLKEKGETVGMVAMIDTTAPTLMRHLRSLQPTKIDSAVRIAILSRQEARRFGLDIDVSAHELQGMGREAQVEYVLRKFGALGDFPDVAVGVRNLELFEHNERLFMEFHPRTYMERICLLRAQHPNAGDEEEFGALAVEVARAREADPSLGWREFAGEVDIRFVPGDHVTVSVEPNVQYLAEALESHMSMELQNLATAMQA